MAVCVDGVGVARSFSKMFLRTALNVVVDGGDIPQIPLQLGCSGYVMVDAAGTIVTTKTASFLDYDQRAFRDVENRLAPLLAGPADGGGDGGFAVGAPVTLQGLKNAAFNGRAGVVAPTPPDVRAAGRVAVDVGGKVFALNKENVVPAEPAAKKAKTAADTFSDDEDDEAAMPALEASPPESVGHADLDAEHAAIYAKLAALAADPGDGAALRAARDEFAAHAAHEEAMMADAGFGGAAEDPLSAAASHRKDHERICALADAGEAAAFAAAIAKHTATFDARYVDAVAKLPGAVRDCCAVGPAK